MSKILLIDSTNNFLRNYSVVPTLTSNGAPNGGVYGFLNSLSYFIRIIRPDKIILAWDGIGGSKKRRAIIDSYKQGRKPTRLNRNFDFELDNPEQNKYWQRQRLQQYLNDLPVTQIIVDDIEADDVIAYLAKVYDNDKKIIISSDKDFYQLLNENTVMFLPAKKQFFNNASVFTNFNIYPVNFALARSVAGDVGDNLPGVKGVGLKTVVKLFPFIIENKKVDLNYIFDYCKQNGEKYEKFLLNRELIENNFKVMNLNDILIGASSINKIHESLDKSLNLNATSFRLKLYEDGINSIGENYFQNFRIFETREN